MNFVVLLVCYTKTDREDWVVLLLDCTDYTDCRNVAAGDFRKRMAFAETVGAVRTDIEAVVVDVIVVFVDRDVVLLEDHVGWDWEIWDTGAMYSAVYFPTAVVRIFDLDQPEGDYYSDS